MKLHLVINGKEAVSAVADTLSRLPLEPLHEVMIRPWSQPGDSEQTKHIYKLYSLLEKYCPEHDVIYWRWFCKYHYGIPILIADQDNGSYEFFQTLFASLPKTMPGWYEKRIKAMEYVEVVGQMNNEQRKAYINMIYRRHPEIPPPPPKKEKKL